MRPLPTTLAALFALLPALARAQGVRTGEVNVRSGPTLSGTQTTGTGLNTGVAPGLGTNDLSVNTGVTTINTAAQTAVNPSAAAMQAQNGGAAGIRSQNAGTLSQAQALAAKNGAVALDAQGRPLAQKTAAKTATAAQTSAMIQTTAVTSPSGSGLSSTVGEIKKAEKLDADAPSEGLGVSSALKKVFDASLAVKTLAPGLAGPGSVAGKTQRAAERVAQTAAIAEQAQPHDAADLYKAAVEAAKEGEAQKALSPEAARQAASTVMSYARARAQSALPELATAAYKAAASGASGARELARALKGLDKWESLLGAPGKPLIKNAAMLKADVKRFQESASAKAGAADAPNIRFTQEGGSYLAQLPRAAVVALPASLAADMELKEDPAAALSSNWLEDVLVAHGSNPGANPGVLFDVARKGAKRGLASVPAAVLSTANLAVRSWFSAAWQFLKRAVMTLLGRADAAASLRRAPTAEEQAVAASVPGAVALDLSRFNAPYLEAQRLLGESAPTPATAKAASAAARKLAEAHASVTGDSSGLSTLEKLAARLAAEERPSSVDLRLLAFWVERMHASAMGAVLSPLAKSGKAAVFFDLTPGSGMVGVVSSSLDAEGLARAGFDVRGGNAAVFGPGGSREELAAALELASGKKAATPKSAPAALDKALAFAKSRPSDAEAVAAQIQADMAGSQGLTFAPVGRVEAEGGALSVSRAVRKKGRSSEELYLLIQTATGRVFGFKSPALVPAR